MLFFPDQGKGTAYTFSQVHNKMSLQPHTEYETNVTKAAPHNSRMFRNVHVLS